MPVIGHADLLEDTARVQSAFDSTLKRLPLGHAARLRLMVVPVYVSQINSYTQNKCRIFICPRDQFGVLLPTKCVERILLHELAHVMATSSQHHDTRFQMCLKYLAGYDR